MEKLTNWIVSILSILAGILLPAGRRPFAASPMEAAPAELKEEQQCYVHVSTAPGGAFDGLKQIPNQRIRKRIG